MMRAAFAVLLLGLVQEDPVAPLAKDLDAADVRKVYRAVSGLAALGEPALPAIEARAKDAKGRVRDYLLFAADEIRAARVVAGLAPPPRVTMKATDRNDVELLAELRMKTGLALTLDNLMGEEKLPEVAIDVKDATMLEAFDAICRAGNVGAAMENGQFMLYQGDYQELPRFFYDRYYFRLPNFIVMKTVDFRKPAVHSFKVNMEMLWDPAAAPCKFSPPVVVEALDDKGKNLVPPPPPPPKTPPKPPENAPAPPDDEPEFEPQVVLELLPPSAAAEKVAVVRGYVSVGVPKTKVTLGFAEEKKPAEGQNAAFEGLVRTSGDYTVKITRVEAALFRVHGEISSKTHKPEELMKMPLLANVVLKGGEATRAFVIQQSEKENAAEIMVSFTPLHLREILVQPGDDRPAPAPVIEKLEVSVVTAVQERKVPFEFRDLKIK